MNKYNLISILVLLALVVVLPFYMLKRKVLAWKKLKMPFKPNSFRMDLFYTLKIVQNAMGSKGKAWE